MNDIFSGNKVTVYANGNKVKELAEYPEVVTECTPTSTITKIELVINYTQDNVLDRLVYTRKEFKLAIGNGWDEQLTHAGWFHITKRVIKGDKDDVVRGHYYLESNGFSYPFSIDDKNVSIDALEELLGRSIKE
ncbi:TPA: hypothetical protein ACOELQ_001969 [Enterobacter mori]